MTLLRLRSAQSHPGETFGELLRRLGESSDSIDCFWDVFIRPALNLPADEVDAGAGLFTVRTALLGRRANSDLVLPTRPLGAMHGDAAGRVLGDRVRLESRVESLDELDGDAVVVAVPPAESARLLGEAVPMLEDSPIVSVHLWFDRKLLPQPLAALLGSDAHWVFDRGALTGHEPERGQYLTVVSSGVPELLEVRGRALVETIAGRADGSPRGGGAPLVAGQPRAVRDDRSAAGRRAAGSRDVPPERRRARVRGRTPAGRRRWRAQSAAAAVRLSTS